MSGYRMGADVSWQGNDWRGPRPQIEFEMLRACFSQNSVDPSSSGTSRNATGSASFASTGSPTHTADMAKREARCVLKTVEPYRLEYPIASTSRATARTTP
ncbi:MAG: hypothetical protein ACLUEK_06005 [Oscillospiraceae bacterium]